MPALSVHVGGGPAEKLNPSLVKVPDPVEVQLIVPVVPPPIVAVKVIVELSEAEPGLLVLLQLEVQVTTGDGLSVNFVCAWETEPTAVRVSLIPASFQSVVNELLEIFPLASAVAVRVMGLSPSTSGTSTKLIWTVSFGWKPPPVMLTCVSGG